MTAFELIMLLIFAVLVSSVLDQLIPRVSPPLIQIALGVVIAVLATNPIEVTFNPDFFLLLFIAPILFNDAKQADKLGLWRNRTHILSLAIGLVVVLMLCVGFAVHALVPSVPLAAAFALGAALGPTDAVAVISLRNVMHLEHKERSLLSGEALINDASGVVAFQFAIAAAVTGTFSLAEASATFAIEFFGGIAFGILLAWLAHLITDRLTDLGLDSNTFHVLFDVTLPFIIYMASEVVHVSGILAVVAAGLVLSAYTERSVGPGYSRLNIVSTNVWSVLSFTLNGIVFVLLGIQLPKAVNTSWENVQIDNISLIAYVLLITAIVVGVRFLWTLLTDLALRDPDTKRRKKLGAQTLHSALVTTLGGPKGAVTLSVIFSTPLLVEMGTPFPQRNLLIFLASGVILCTLLLANFLLPVVSPKTATDSDEEVEAARGKVAVLRSVMDRLAEERTPSNSGAVSAVLKSYHDRIEAIQQKADLQGESSVKLRVDLDDHLEEYLLDLMDAGRVSEEAGYPFLQRIERQRSQLQHHEEGRRSLSNTIRHSSTTWRVLWHSVLHWRNKLSFSSESSDAHEVQMLLDKEAIRYLQRLSEAGGGPYHSEVVARVLVSYQRSLAALQSSRPDITGFARTTNKMEDVQRLAYNIELEEIRYALGRDEITRETAKDMRDNVYLMLVDLDADIV